MKRILLLLIAAGVSLAAVATPFIAIQQERSTRARVYFSTQVPVNGVATEGKEFYIDPAKGSFVYVVVDNYPTPFNFSQLKVKVYKADGLQNKMVEEKSFDINATLYYTYIKYSFFEAGTYTFDLYSTANEFIGSGSISIKKNNTVATNTSAEAKSSGTSSSTSTTTSDPYAKSKVYFSTDVPSFGIAKDVKSFDVKPGGGFVYVIVDNYPNNFKVSSLKLYMYKMIDGKYEKRDEVTYTINSNYYFTYFKYTFTDAGQYKFVVYDVNNKYVNTGFVTLNWAAN